MNSRSSTTRCLATISCPCTAQAAPTFARTDAHTTGTPREIISPDVYAAMLYSVEDEIRIAAFRTHLATEMNAPESMVTDAMVLGFVLGVAHDLLNASPQLRVFNEAGGRNG